MTSIEKIKQLRALTAISLASCKEALDKTNGDLEAAKVFLKKRGFKIDSKKMSRATDQGIIHSYIHTNKKIGVLIDLRCETDFVAKSEDFQNLAHHLCLQIVATNPLYLKSEDITPEILAKEREIYAEQIKDKPKKTQEIIVTGKLNKYFEEVCLLSQSFIKNPEETIGDLIKKSITQFGENIVIKSFVRYQI